MLILNDNIVYPWSSKNGINFRGYIIYDNNIYRDNKALDLIGELTKNKEIKDIKAIKDMLFKFNGCFNLIIDSSERMIISVDRVRSLPLFYSFNDGEIIVSDNAYSLIEYLNHITLNELAIEEIIKDYLFVGGKDTLINEVKQVQASEYIIYDKVTKKVENFDYFTFIHSDFIENTSKLKEMLVKAYENTAKNLVKALNGRKAIVPLSGGADSRMIVSMLKSQGYENVLCYTYGKIGNNESRISKEVADEMGYEWVIIPYTKKMWRDLANDEAYYNYKINSANLASTPHIQDYLAIKLLKEKYHIPNDSVFIPGHSGDLIAGSHIADEYVKENVDTAKFYNLIFRKFYRDYKLSVELKNKVISRIDLKNYNTNSELASLSDWYNIKERQGKYIINSVRAYESFGYEWLIPLWDNNLFEFWKHVPMEQRYNRKLYFDTIKTGLRSTNDSSKIKTLGDLVRKNAVLTVIARKLNRLYIYFNSPLCTEYEFKFTKYFSAFVRANDSFCVQQIYAKDYINEIKKMYKDKIVKLK